MRSNHEQSGRTLAVHLAAALACVVDLDAPDEEVRERVVERTFLIAAGGTGGHVIPGLEVARELRSRGHRSIFVAAGRGLEQTLVPEAGFELEAIEIGALNRVSAAVRIKTVLRLPLAIVQAWRLLSRLRPGAVLSLGGYASGPLVAAALLRGVPVVALEPNAYPGLANRLAGRFVKRALLGFEEGRGYFRKGRSEVSGVPVRKEFFEIPAKKQSRPFMILVTGGSQGSSTLNAAALGAVEMWSKEGFPGGVKIVHQAGSRAYTEVAQRYASLAASADVGVTAVPFIEDMPAAFGEADLIVCRAGASAVAELAAAGKPAVLIPFPFAADDHQWRNAQALAKRGAAVVVRDGDWDAERMKRETEAIAGDPERVAAMSRAVRAEARPDAALIAADRLEEAARPERNQ